MILFILITSGIKISLYNIFVSFWGRKEFFKYETNNSITHRIPGNFK